MTTQRRGSPCCSLRCVAVVLSFRNLLKWKCVTVFTIHLCSAEQVFQVKELSALALSLFIWTLKIFYAKQKSFKAVNV